MHIPIFTAVTHPKIFIAAVEFRTFLKIPLSPLLISRNLITQLYNVDHMDKDSKNKPTYLFTKKKNIFRIRTYDQRNKKK